MMKCGLLGRKLGHSYSPQIHAHLGDYSYELFEKEPEELENFLKSGDFSGLNVTVPYKKDVIPYLDEMTHTAARLGAVNTIICKEGRLLGHNTDYFGFQTMVRSSGLEIAGRKILVLGSGGASNTAVAVLQEMGAEVVVISRSGENNYDNLDLHSDATVIVNTTPVGMYPHVGKSPVSLDKFPKLTGVLDVIYNPARTKLLLEAEARGLTAMNGLIMLVAQAKEAAEWFTGRAIPDSVIVDIHTALRKQMENIVLIGMPGSGKTTVGKHLAQKTGKIFVDADSVLETNAGRTIPEIFAEGGEALFRKLESETLAALGKQSGLVLATGGGCVTQLHNYPLIHQNGSIFCLNRDLSLLSTEGRPLSQTHSLSDMYRIRKPLYESFADYHIDNSGSADETVARIMEVWK